MEIAKRYYYSYVGTSAETKPASEVEPGNEFYETDTGRTYIYDGSAWVLKQSPVQLTGSLPAGTDILGKIGIDQTIDGTSNRVVSKISQTAGENVVSLDKGIIQNAFAITPNDSTDLAQTTTALYVGVDGDVKVDLAGDGTGITFKALAAGVWHPMAVTKVYFTGTDATDIIGAY